MAWKRHILNIITLTVLATGLPFGGIVHAQVVHPWTPADWGYSDTSVKYNCGEKYQWPQSPCPEVQIKQKHDHSPLPQYQAQGWDTVMDCETRESGGIELSCMPYVPVRFFNGQYTVDTIPYDPPDPTFSRGIKMPVTTDDDFAPTPTAIPFNFFFFGQKKNAFVLGANGLITFDVNAAGHYCPWRIDEGATLPWPNSKTSAPNGLDCTKANMRDAIYGIYEDTHPIASYLHGDQGIYYGIQESYPGDTLCRKIICSWNGIPTFPGSRNQNNRCTYQIVCYEGSNIIEVHIKRRGLSPWQSGRGVLGIQNATGEGQVNGGPGTSTMQVYPGAPAAYYPTGGNLLTSAITDSIAFRFTPQGPPINWPNVWYRILDTYRDTVINGVAQRVYDTVQLRNAYQNHEAYGDIDDSLRAGYYIPMGSSSCSPNLTVATVNPDRVSRYVFNLKFYDAEGRIYDLSDTIVIGVDTLSTLTLRPRGESAAQHEMTVCANQDARLMLEFPVLQDTANADIVITRINGGVRDTLPNSLLTLGQMYIDEENSLKCIPLILQQDGTTDSLQPDKIDSILVYFSVNFTTKCHNTAQLLVRRYPVYHTIVDTGICQGETFLWDLNNQTYTVATNSPQVVLHSQANCDSTIHLHLYVSDNTQSIDTRAACQPIEWHGNWYYESGTATFDTINQWDCDSTVLLDFTLTPMTPIIAASLDHFDFNHMDVVLTDVSTGGMSRRWFFPTGEPQYNPVAYYTAPYNVDSVVISMEETSPYGCIDTATIVIPFFRDVIWVPNTFTPDLPDGGNDLFGSKSTHLLRAQMLIYNRFGTLIYHCEEVDCTWDGTDADGNPCPQGSYMYVIRYTTDYEPRTTYTAKGSVTLLR